MSKIQKISTNNIESTRIETGPLQIDDDWPGTFIRGDNCFDYSFALKEAVDNIKNGNKVEATTLILLESLSNLLDDSNLKNNDSEEK